MLKWFRKPSKDKKDDDDNCAFERCIICGQETTVRKDLPVDSREHYVRGCGQMCQSCYYNAYVKPDDPMDEQSMKALIEMTKRVSKR